MSDIIEVSGGSLKYLRREKRRFRSGKDWWVVADPYTLKTAREGELLVPTDFETDGASVPRMFWRMMPPMSEYTRIAVCHDYFYRFKGVCTWFFEGSTVETKITKARADEIFRDGMKYLEVTAWKIPVMYRAVRIGGGREW